MISLPREQFEKIMGETMDAIPQLYYERLKNVAFILEDEPGGELRERLHLGHGQQLYGLYEGVPLPQRGGRIADYPPDKITLFKHHIEAGAESEEEIIDRIKNTIWHEVAHYFGLDHSRIHELEG